MKRIIDFHKTLLIDMIQTKKFKHRLIRYWGTTYTSEGTHVFIKKFQIHPHGKTAEKLKLYDTLGIKQQILDANFSGVKKAWLYFKPSRWDPRYRITDAEELSAKINSYFTPDMTINVNLHFKDNSDATKFQGLTKEQILQYVDENYKELIDTCEVGSSSNTLIDEAIGMYALLDNEGIFNVTVKKASIAPYKVNSVKLTTDSEYIDEIEEYEYTTKKEVATYSVIYLELSIKKIGTVFKESQFIRDMMAENNQLRVRNRDLMMSNEAGATRQEAIRRELDEDNNDAPNEFFEGKKLRVATTQSNYLDRDLFVNLVMGSIEVDYEEWPKKKLNFWNYVALVVLFVIAVVLAVFTGGGSLYVFFGALSIYLGVVVVALNMYMGSHYDSPEDRGKAEKMGRWATVYQKIAIISSICSFAAAPAPTSFAGGVGQAAGAGAGVAALTGNEDLAKALGAVAIVSGGVDMVMNSGSDQAATSAANTASSTTSTALASASAEMTQTTLHTATKSVHVVNAEGVASLMASKGIEMSLSFSSGITILNNGKQVIQIGLKTLSAAAKAIGDLITTRETNKFNSLVDAKKHEIRKYQKENDALVAEQLQDLADKELHIGVEDIKTYTNQSRIGSMMFNTDQFYEESIMNIGRPSFVPIGMREIAPIKYEI